MARVLLRMVLLRMVHGLMAEMGWDQWHAEGGVCTPLGVEPLGDPSC